MLILLFLFALFRHLQGAPLTADEGGVIADPLPASDILPRADVVFGSRTTSDIVTSCLFTIFACTWTAIHPNIPSPADSRWNIFKRRLVTTIYALLAPEFITVWAFRQYVGAKRIMNEYNRDVARQVMKQPDSDSEQSYIQRLWVGVKKWLSGPSSHRAVPEAEQQLSSERSFFQNLWANVSKFCVGIKKWIFYAPPFDRVRKGKIQPWTTTHGFFVQMGGFMLCRNGRPIQTLGSLDIAKKIRANIIKAPCITKAEIEDRSKGDITSKTIVILQTTWFIVQCIARWSTSIPVTELEIVTLGFAMLNGITYALWWHKPQNVGMPVYLEIKALLPTYFLDNKTIASSISETELGIELPPMNTETASSSQIIKESDLLVPKNLTDAKLHKPSFLVRKLKNDWNSSSGIQLFFSIPYRLILGVLRPLNKLSASASDYLRAGDLRVPIFFAEPVVQMDVVCFSSVFATLFGCVHLVPSFFLHFSSPSEMWLWRIFAAFITLQPFSFFIAPYLHIDRKTWSLLDQFIETVFGPLMQGALPLYIVARLGLIILSFVSLRDLPPNDHLAIDWISSIPHL